jgi:uncharacterized protein
VTRLKVTVTNKDLVLGSNTKVASSFISRLIGLMFREKMVGFDSLMIESCNSIHTCFMRYPIDVMFINKENKIIKIIRNIKPWRMTGMYFKANKVLELPEGTISEGIVEGDHLEVVCIN